MSNSLARCLTHTEIFALEQDGFVRAQGLVVGELVQTLGVALIEIIEQQRNSDSAEQQQAFWGVKKGLGTVRFTDLSSIVEISGAGRLISELKAQTSQILRRSDIDLRSVHALHKPAYGNSATPWHQDPAYAGKNFVFDNVTFWIPFSSVNEFNSCLQFVPGSHRGQVLRDHQSVAGIGTALVSEPREEETRVTLTAEPGDVILHRSYILHRAMANSSSADRTALVVVVGPQPASRQ